VQDLKSDWRQVPIRSVVRQVRESVRTQPNNSYRLLGVRWYGQGPFIREEVTTASSKATRLYPVRPGQFIYNRLFAWKGSFGVVAGDLDGCFVSGEFPLFESDPSQLLVDYLFLYMNRPSVWESIEIESTGSTSVSRNRWKEERFLEKLILLPSTAEQRRIVDLMSSVDSYVAALQQQADAARSARSAVLSELLSAGGDDWTETTLGDIVEFGRERLDPRLLNPDELLCHWSIPALDEFNGPITEPAKQIGSHKFRVKQNAVIYSLLNPRIPRFALVAGGANVVCSTEFAVMYPSSKVDPRFLFVLGSSSLFQANVASSANGTTKSRERVRPSDLEGMQVRLPPIDVQQSIVDVVFSMDEVTQSADKAVVDAKNLRSGLLSDLLSGAHEIPESYDRLLGAA